MRHSAQSLSRGQRSRRRVFIGSRSVVWLERDEHLGDAEDADGDGQEVDAFEQVDRRRRSAD